jgi:[CysO sulfur-carrier protein]-S-L-cysteine hydrolase
VKPPAPLILSFDLYGAMLAQVRSVPLEEMCGLLGGREGSALLHFPIENVLQSADAFRMHAQSLVDAIYTMEEHNLSLVAIYHSHPHGPGVPSPRDLAENAYPEALHIIWSPNASSEGGWHMRVFQLSSDSYEEVPWELT